MPTREELGRAAGWKVFADAVAEQIGFHTPLHTAALEARRSRAHEAAFYAALAELSDADRQRLRARLEAIDANRTAVVREYARRGVV